MQTHNPLPGLRGIAPTEVLTRQATVRLQPRLGSPARDKLIAAAKDAARALHLRGAPRTILEKLVSSYGGTPVNGEIIVWPSNAYLANQTGLNHATIRRAVTRLILHGLIIPKDSPRRYRFARRDRATGTIIDAYGFILSPLIHKHPEFSCQLLAAEIARRHLNTLDDDISRTAIAIRTALAAALPFDSYGKAMPLQTRFNEIAASLPRRGKPGERQQPIIALQSLQADAETLFFELTNEATNQGIDAILHGSAVQNAVHLEKKPENSTENLKAQPQEKTAQELFLGKATNSPIPGNEPRATNLTLPLILTACPALLEYRPDRPIRSINDLVDAGHLFRSFFGASKNAWDEGVTLAGPVVTALIAVYVYQLMVDADALHGPGKCSGVPQNSGKYGGLFRSLLRAASNDQFDIGAALDQLRRKRMS